MKPTGSLGLALLLLGGLLGAVLLAGTLAFAQSPPARKKLKNIALGKPYTVSTPANYPLCSDDDDEIQLTDGKYTEGHFWSSKSTVGWQEKQRLSNEYAWTVLCPPEELTQYQRRIDEAKAAVPPDSVYRKRINLIEEGLLKVVMLETSARIRERLEKTR